MALCDRRKFPRLEGHFRVDVLNMGDDPQVSPWEAVLEAEALDISMQGMRIKASHDVPLKSQLSVIVYYQGHESICLSEVVWKREVMGEFIYGLFFREWSILDPALEQALAQMQTDKDNVKMRKSPPTAMLVTRFI